MTSPSYWRRLLCAASLGLAALALTASPLEAQIGAGALTGTNEYEGREEGETIPLSLETGSFEKSLPFDVTFKVSGPMPPGFGGGSRLDARYVEFKRQPDCATFFSQFAVSRQRLADLNVTDTIPVRRRRRAEAQETSGFRQATVFDAKGVTLQARLLEGMVRVGAEADPEAAAAAEAAAAPKGATFLVDFPALRPNHYYCFQFVSRRALSQEDLDKLHEKFAKAVDQELRKPEYQQERDDYTTFVVGIDDYERLRVRLSAVIEKQLAEGTNQVVLAPPNSFFNVGARLEYITAPYREEFERIAVRTVGARLIAIRNYQAQIGHAVDALRRVAESPLEVDGVKRTGLEVVLQSETPGVVEFRQKLQNAGVIPTELNSLSVEQLKAQFQGVPAGEPAKDLKGIWDPKLIQPRIDNLQELSRALDSLVKLAADAGIPPEQLEAAQVNVSPISEQDVQDIQDELDAAESDEDEKFWQAELDEAKRQLAQGNVRQKVNLVYQVSQFLNNAVANLRSLQKLLEEREMDIRAWVEQVLVEEQASLVVGGTTVAEYDTRAIWYMSADIGSGISELEDFFTYVGWNIYLRPVNKKAHLSWTARPFGIKEELMRRFSFTIGVVQSGFDEVEGEFEGVIGNNAAVLGAGFRINDSLRFSVGGLIFESQDPDPLVDSTRLTWSPYVAISLDWNIGASLSGLLPGR